MKKILAAVAIAALAFAVNVNGAQARSGQFCKARVHHRIVRCLCAPVRYYHHRRRHHAAFVYGNGGATLPPAPEVTYVEAPAPRRHIVYVQAPEQEPEIRYLPPPPVRIIYRVPRLIYRLPPPPMFYNGGGYNYGFHQGYSYNNSYNFQRHFRIRFNNFQNQWPHY